MKTSIHIENKLISKPSRLGFKYHIKTFGCQMNEHDSEKIAGIFNSDGMRKSEDIDQADILFVNTLVPFVKMLTINYTEHLAI